MGAERCLRVIFLPPSFCQGPGFGSRGAPWHEHHHERAEPIAGENRQERLGFGLEASGHLKPQKDSTVGSHLTIKQFATSQAERGSATGASPIETSEAIVEL